MKGYKAGFVALIGEPNAGKSTLTNVLVGEKVSIVTPKPQTTRQRMTGLLTDDRTQLVFVDAPGVLKSKTGLNSFLQDEVAGVVRNADVVLLLLASESTENSAKGLIELARSVKKPFVVVITKADRLKGTSTPRFFKYLLDEKLIFFSISATLRPDEAREEVLNAVRPLLPDSDGPLYDTEIYTTQTLREMAAEAVREACFLNLQQEIPYGLAVRMTKFKEDEGPVVKISADVIVEKDNHKAMVIGTKASMLKKIGIEARASIEKILGRQVHLELHVAVKPNWFKNKRILEELGYVVRD